MFIRFRSLKDDNSFWLCARRAGYIFPYKQSYLDLLLSRNALVNSTNNPTNMLSKLLAVVVFMLSLSKALAECRLKGVNIAGFDFGCSSDVRFLLKLSDFTANVCRVNVHPVVLLLPYCRRESGRTLGSINLNTIATG